MKRLKTEVKHSFSHLSIFPHDGKAPFRLDCKLKVSVNNEQKAKNNQEGL